MTTPLKITFHTRKNEEMWIHKSMYHENLGLTNKAVVACQNKIILKNFSVLF